jgi:hypothetical protein
VIDDSVALSDGLFRKPSDWNMRLPDSIKECVCFLCVRYTGGENAGKYESKGTGVFVFVNERDWDFLYLVTAKHVVEWAKKKNFKTLYARVNTNDGGHKYIDVGLDWARYNPEKHDIDVAATAVPFSPSEYGYQALPLRKPLSLLNKIQPLAQFGFRQRIFLFLTVTGNKPQIRVVSSQYLGLP